jgi:beta-xylosidase
MKHWECKGIAFSSFDKGNIHRERDLWGSDTHFYNGKFFLYGAYAWWGERTENNFYVVESDNPQGPFTNFRWVKGNKTKKNIDGITPKIFVEKNGGRYIVWAPTLQPVEENYLLIAKLSTDDTIDEQSITNLGSLKDFYEGPSIRKRGEIYYLVYDENCGAITKRNRTPKRLSYATSANITGPYVYRGVILTIEDLPGNTNIQGSIEEFNGQWYAFYHRALNGAWNRRALCIEKIEFDENGLIKPVKPTSSGVAEGLDTAKTIWFNTAVFGKNHKPSTNGKYGSVLVSKRGGAAEIGFRHILFTGKEKKISLSGTGLQNILSAKVFAGAKLIGESTGGGEILLRGVPAGKSEMTLAVSAKGNVFLETLDFEL